MIALASKSPPVPEDAPLLGFLCCALSGFLVGTIVGAWLMYWLF